MFNDLSKRVKAIKPRPTLAVSNLASQRMIEGRDLIELGAGESDFDAGVLSPGGERCPGQAIDHFERVRTQEV